MRIHAVGGLANRLRAVLSHRERDGFVEVGWQQDEPVSCAHFLDVFEPITRVSWGPPGSRDAEMWSVAKGAPDGWESAYADLRPVPAVQARITTMLARLGDPFMAMHVRRTDHLSNCIALGQPAEPLSAWTEWANHHPSIPCFIATDNLETQRTLMMVVSRPFIAADMPDGSVENRATQHRYGTLADAVVDMFVASRARWFLGSRNSSFTDTINILRRDAS